MKNSIDRAPRYAAFMGKFGVSVVCHWLSRTGFEVAMVDQVGLDVIAFNRRRKQWLGLTVKAEIKRRLAHPERFARRGQGIQLAAYARRSLCGLLFGGWFHQLIGLDLRAASLGGQREHVKFLSRTAEQIGNVSQHL